MKKKINKLMLFLVFLILIAAVALIINVTGAKRLNSVEIKEYQGQKLSSINDFRENSIKEPQNIDMKNYIAHTFLS
jgi:cell division protein FtsL